MEQALQQRARTWIPTERAALDAELRQAQEALLPPLSWLLQRAEEPRFAAGAALAVVLQAKSTQPSLLAVAAGRGPANARAAALLAAGQLEQLDEATLLEFCTDPAPQLRRAALRLIGARPDPELPLLLAVVEQFADLDPEVRAAAASALPAVVPQALAPRLRALLEDPLAGNAARTALAHLEPGDDSGTVILGALRTDPEIAAAIAGELEPAAVTAEIREQLWRLVRDAGEDQVRAAALRCLCRAGESGAQLPADVIRWQPGARLEAARLLVQDGNPRGTALLLDLVDRGDAGDRDDGDAGHQARLLLARLSRQPPHTAIEAFQHWALETLGPAAIARPRPPAPPAPVR